MKTNPLAVVEAMLTRYLAWRKAGWNHAAACQRCIHCRRNREAVKLFLELPEIKAQRTVKP